MSEAKMRVILDLGYLKLLQDDQTQIWARYDLTPDQAKHLGERISPLTCWRKHDFCGKHLKRPHLTCFHCHLRRVIQGDLPTMFPVHLLMFWMRRDRSWLEEFLSKKLYSLAETFA
jgi:hypothetical protein